VCEAAGYVYTGPNQTGSSTLIGLVKGDRYAHSNSSDLQKMGIYRQIQSGYLVASVDKDVSLTLFTGDNFDGGFLQMTWLRGSGESTFWSTPGWVSSFLMTATSPGGANQFMLSYKSIFQSQWDSSIDSGLGSNGYRNGEPILTWMMFTSDPNYKYLDPRLAYIKVYQNVVLRVPCWPSDYNAWMEYSIYLYSSGGNVRAYIPQYRWWVEGGAFHDQVRDRFVPAVASGASTLQDKMNQQLATFDPITNGRVTDVFYLPGAQGSPPGADVHGNTTDDVAIVFAF
jgi:hypothetical protein